MKKMNKQGFTLIELMVVVIIVGILAAVAVPMMSANKNKAIASEAIATLGSMNTAAKLCEVEKGVNDDITPGALITAGFLITADLNGTYFNNAFFQDAVWDNTNYKFIINTPANDKNNDAAYTITWDGDSYTTVTTKQ